MDADVKAAKVGDGKRRRLSAWWLLLALPYLGLCFPAMYNRAEPALWGFPFFYWYQFAWVVICSVLLGVVYFKTKSRAN